MNGWLILAVYVVGFIFIFMTAAKQFEMLVSLYQLAVKGAK